MVDPDWPDASAETSAILAQDHDREGGAKSSNASRGRVAVCMAMGAMLVVALMCVLGRDAQRPDSVQSEAPRPALRSSSFDSEAIISDVRVAGTYQQCGMMLKRFEDKDVTKGSKLKPNSKYDPDFPPIQASIGGERRCKAFGTSMVNCRSMNQWVSMVELGTRKGGCQGSGYCPRSMRRQKSKTFKVFAPTGPSYMDVEQGLLGNCYFHAALAAVTFTHPELIDAMFVRRHLWKVNIFTTKWLINGKESLIEVDQMVPGAQRNRAYFAGASDSNAWWVAILEKAYAKIYDTYFMTYGGLTNDVLAGLTRAFVHRWNKDDHSKEELWTAMVWATSRRHAMTGGFGSQLRAKYGLTGMHAYAVLRVYEHTQWGKVVNVFNPWNKDRYMGSIPNWDKDDGHFNMTFDEFWDALGDNINFADINTGYKVSSLPLYHGLQRTSGSVRFTMGANSKDVYVSLTWPGTKFGFVHEENKDNEELECNADVKTSLKVVKEGRRLQAISAGEPTSDPNIFIGTRPYSPYEGVMHAKVTGGAGSYLVEYDVEFGEENYLRDVHLTVYAPEKVHFGRDGGSDISDSGSSDHEPVAELAHPSATWQRLQDRACRAHNGDTSKDGEGTSHKVDDHAHTLEACMRHCEESSYCTGVEFTQKFKHCEIWTKPIAHDVHARGFSCMKIQERQIY